GGAGGAGMGGIIRVCHAGLRGCSALDYGAFMKFELIDQVEDISDERIVAVKAVTTAEEYLGDHFPGFPILPGVLMLEVMVQAGQRLAEHRVSLGSADPKAGGAWVVRDVRNVRYGGMVRPGQVLRVEVTLRNHDETGIDLQGSGTVDGETAVQGRFRLEPLGVPATNAV
ncbi:MAG: hypothetical protein AAF797_18050, partial [Planctomycetota bacterium]